MDLSFFAQKSILLTGATGDLGATLARKLSRTAGCLVLSATSRENLDQLIHSLPGDAKAVAIPADLSRKGEADTLAAEALDKAGHIDILINNAGKGYFALMEEVDEDKLRHIFEVNTFSPLALTRAMLPHMIRREQGRIVNIVSSAGRVPIPTVGVYGGSKSALAVMTNTMRLELAPKKVDVVNIYPGTINDSFERNAMSENNRMGICPDDDCGTEEEKTALEILEASAGKAGEVWLEKTGKWMALSAIAWPGMVDKRLAHLRDRTVKEGDPDKPKAHRTWRLLQVESSLACNLNCIMCPWTAERRHLIHRGHMPRAVWEALVPHLGEVASVDFTGGGEPLLQPRLFDWIEEAGSRGCDTGFLTNGLLLSREFSRRILDVGLNWIGFSIDGADKATYEKIRRGSDFNRVCDNIRCLTSQGLYRRPLTMMNFVIMQTNWHQMEKIIQLAHDLGIDQVNFKQCDVIRGDHGKGHGLFQSKETKQLSQLKKALARARRLGRKLDVKTTAFAFTPEELAVCDQDPRNSMFIRYDGSVSPCINLAIGGPSTFLGEEVVFPHVTYGNLPEPPLPQLWQEETCRFYRRRFSRRVKAHDTTLEGADLGHDLIKLKEAFHKAVQAMPEAPDGCRTCHYLYDI